MRIAIEVANRYGNPVIRPANEAAVALANIAGVRELQARHLIGAAQLGHEIVEVHNAQLPAHLAAQLRAVAQGLN